MKLFKMFKRRKDKIENKFTNLNGKTVQNVCLQVNSEDLEKYQEQINKLEDGIIECRVAANQLSILKIRLENKKH